MNKITKQFQQNFSELSCKTPKSLALAVSGGSDSIAMLFLAKEWSDTQGVELSVLTVDHNLRSISRLEAQYVGTLCAQLRLQHQIFDWKSEGRGNIQSSAREARYKLMTNWCHENNVDTLLTAHHLDDQVENFLIRLSRGSGLFGLLDHSKNINNDITILRPLFNVPKKELQEYLRDRNIEWYEDESNKDTKYQRSNIRKWLDQMPAELEPELFKSRVLQSQQHLRSAANYIKQALGNELAQKVTIHHHGAEYCLGSGKLIEHITLSELLMLIGKKNQPPRGESVDLLLKEMSKGPKKMTLHGCIAQSMEIGGFITVKLTPEHGRSKKLVL